MNNNSTYRVSIKTIIKDKKWDVLLMYNDKYNTWNIPLWWLEDWETIIDCIIREINHINQKPLWFITSNTWLNKEMPWIWNLIYDIELVNLDFKESDECKQIWFFNINTIKNINTPENVKLIFDLIF